MGLGMFGWVWVELSTGAHGGFYSVRRALK